MLFRWGAGFASVVMVLGCAGMLPSFPEPERQDPISLSMAAPALPDLGTGSEVEDGIVRIEVALEGTQPGMRGRLWVYLPSGPAPEGGRPAVLIAPAGSDLISGMRLGEADVEEHLPYVREGFVVVAYEIEGDGDEHEDMMAFAEAYGGLYNGVVALRYLTEKVPDVHLDHVFVAGHSSAADVALLMAAHHPGLAGVAAYNSGGEGCWFQPAEVLNILAMLGDGIAEMCQSTRALSHMAHLRDVPVFLFGSEGDGVVPVEAIHTLAASVPEGEDLTVQIVEGGDHYSSMIDEGVPSAIGWMKSRIAR